MLIPILFAATLISSVVPAPALPSDELPPLPIAMSAERAAQFVSFVAPLPSEQTPASLPTKTVPQSSAVGPAPVQEKSYANLRNQMYRSNGHIVKVSLASHRTVVGKLVAVDNESFTLRRQQHSPIVKILYTDVVGSPKIRPSANEIIGWTIVGLGAIVAIPAIPFLFLGLAINGDIAD